MKPQHRKIGFPNRNICPPKCLTLIYTALMQVIYQKLLLVPQHSKTKKPHREPVDPGTHQMFDLLTEGRGHRREGDSIPRVPLLEETKLDTAVVPGVDMTKGQGALLGTKENGWGGNASDVEVTMKTETVPWIIAGRNVFWDVICTIK